MLNRLSSWNKTQFSYTMGTLTCTTRGTHGLRQHGATGAWRRGFDSSRDKTLNDPWAAPEGLDGSCVSLPVRFHSSARQIRLSSRICMRLSRYFLPILRETPKE